MTKSKLRILLVLLMSMVASMAYAHSFSVREFTAVLGAWDMSNSPMLDAEVKGIVYTSSHPEVAVVFQDGVYDPYQFSIKANPQYLKGGSILPIGEGMTEITAYNPADGTSASYTLYVVYQPSTTIGTSETITVKEPGTLRTLMAELESTRVRDLTLHGKLNADDLKLLHEHTGRLQNLESIDMKDVSFEYGGEPYATASKKVVGFTGSIIHSYYLSDENRDESGGSGNMTGGYDGWVKHYTNRLDALFSGNETLRRVVWPDCSKGIGQDALANSGIISLIFPNDITYIGDGAFSGCEKISSVNIPSSVKEMGSAFTGCTSIVNVGDLSNMKKIEKEAFKGCEYLIGNVGNMALDLSNVDTIPENAFYGCHLLSNVRLAKTTHIGANAFQYCYNLKNINLPEGLERICEYAFRYCSSLSDITIPSSIRQMSYFSFMDTPFQNELTFEDGIKYIGNVAIANDNNNTKLRFREGTRVIADEFHAECTMSTPLTIQVYLPSSLKRIGDRAFAGMNGEYSKFRLESIELPEGLEEIGNEAFTNNKMLTSIELPTTLYILGTWAFENCTGLDKITIPEQIERIGDRVFSGCTGLVKVTLLNKSFQPIEEQYLRYSDIVRGGWYMFRNCTGLEQVTIGGKVTIIPDYIFEGCSNLLKVDFEERVCDTLAIGDGAFHSCTNLQTMSTGDSANVRTQGVKNASPNLPKLEIPAGTTTIGKSAFSDCTGIKSITMHDGITELSPYTFYRCSSVEEVHLPSTIKNINRGALLFIEGYKDHPFDLYCAAIEPPSVQQAAFQDKLTDCNLYVSPESEESYRAAQTWKNFTVIADETVPVTTVKAINSKIVSAYDLNGRKLSMPKKGLNILHMSDGSVKRVMVK